MFYWRNIAEEKYMSCVKYDMAGMRHCIKCLVNMDDTSNLQRSNTPQPSQTMIAREEYARLSGVPVKLDDEVVHKGEQDLF